MHEHGRMCMQYPAHMAPLEGGRSANTIASGQSRAGCPRHMTLYRQQVVIVITIKPVQAAGEVGRICGVKKITQMSNVNEVAINHQSVPNKVECYTDGVGVYTCYNLVAVRMLLPRSCVGVRVV